MKFVPALSAIVGLVVFANAHASSALELPAGAAQPSGATLLVSGPKLDTKFSNRSEMTVEPNLEAEDVSALNDIPLASAVNPEYDENQPKERIYDGLLPGDDYTITMDAFPDQNGSNECVQLIKSLLGAPRTFFWKEGRKIKEHIQNIKPGTAIATFVKGQYPQTGRTGMHAAIFVRANQAGIYVLDQYRTRKAVTERFIPWHNSNAKRSNNASAYSTIVW